jgi:hypothetical protein
MKTAARLDEAGPPGQSFYQNNSAHIQIKLKLLSFSGELL